MINYIDQADTIGFVYNTTKSTDNSKTIVFDIYFIPFLN